MRRKTDSGKPTFFRSDRFCRVNENQWFFATRDEGDKGPFQTRDEAERALRDYIREKTGEYRPNGEPWLTPGSGN
jgi:hypothetical protein